MCLSEVCIFATKEQLYSVFPCVSPLFCYILVELHLVFPKKYLVHIYIYEFIIKVILVIYLCISLNRSSTYYLSLCVNVYAQGVAHKITPDI